MSRAQVQTKYLSINKVAMMLDISDTTIKRWYKWWEGGNNIPEDMELPPYYHLDRRGTKFFKEDDIHLLEEFKDKMQHGNRGCMSDFNAAYQWGNRGKQIMANKERKKKDGVKAANKK